MNRLTGLSQEEVIKRQNEGKHNQSTNQPTKSISSIIRANVFTLFNIYHLLIAIILIIVGSYASLVFMIAIIVNTTMFIIQEIRAMKMIEKLNLLKNPKTLVIRDSNQMEIGYESLVLGDLVFLQSGMQVTADSTVMEGVVEVDNSLLTGESDPILIRKGDSLISGSHILSGSCYAEVVHVGNDNYVETIKQSITLDSDKKSDLLAFFQSVTKYLSLVVLPIGAILFYQAYIVRLEAFDAAIIAISTVLLGLLPKGLVLLTTLILMTGVYKLGKKNTLVQDIYSLETLAKTDVLCLDKTGTLTEGQMKVSSVEVTADIPLKQINHLMQHYISASLDNNATFTALKEHFGNSQIPEVAQVYIPFSSERKWGGVSLTHYGTLIVGAPDRLTTDNHVRQHVDRYMTQGKRVLALTHSPEMDLSESYNVLASKVIALIIIEDPVRKDAKEAVDFFKTNRTIVKVISGDNPVTVASIAKELDITGHQEAIDATTLTTDALLEDAIHRYHVFGRATPVQKQKMVRFLQHKGQKVAMTGDGVNDLLALHQADCSIAMGSGSDSARQISKVVILDGKLSSLITAVKEGNIMLNNVIRSASMYYFKTIYMFILSIACIVLNISFPFLPLQITFLDNFVEGFPSFMLNFEPISLRPKLSLIEHIKVYALPNALGMLISMLLSYIMQSRWSLSGNDYVGLLFFILLFTSLHLIYRIFSPFTPYRVGVFILNLIGIGAGLYLFSGYMGLPQLNPELLMYSVLYSGISWFSTYFIRKLVPVIRN